MCPSISYEGNALNRPKAGINWVLLDEQFKFVSGGFSPVGNNPYEVKTHDNDAILKAISVAKNGYLYVFVSNESPVDVFFDNLQVVHDKSPILEETHYYPYGLTMAGISSKALNSAPENKYKWNKGSELQNKEFSDGSGLELYATNFRSLDPQLGRWWQIDPRPESGLAFSPYVAMNDNPISITDPLGDIVKYERGEGISKKEFRQFKREIRQLKRNSESFGELYNILKRDKQVFTYSVKNTSSGGKRSTTKDGQNLTISFHGRDPQENSDEKLSRVAQVAHETGHAIRKLYNLDPAEPQISTGTLEERNRTTDALANYKNVSESGAGHIENLVLGELIQSKSPFFEGLNLKATNNGAGLEIVYRMVSGGVSHDPIVTDINLFKTYPKEYYSNEKHNIYEELNIPNPKK